MKLKFLAVGVILCSVLIYSFAQDNTPIVPSGGGGGSGTVTNVTSNFPFITVTGAGTGSLGINSNATKIAIATFTDNNGSSLTGVGNASTNSLVQNWIASSTNNFNGFINLAISSATGGKILQNTQLYIHSPGPDGITNFACAFKAGNTTLTGTKLFLGGYLAGSALTSGDSNVIIAPGGGNALQSMNNGIIIGTQAARGAITGADLTIVGRNAYASGTGGTITAIGSGSLGGAGSSTGDTALGYLAGDAITAAAANNNTFLGSQSGNSSFSQSTSVSNSVAIGYASFTLAHNAFVVGNSLNNIGIATNSPAVKQHFAGANTIIGPTGSTFKNIFSATAVLDFSSTLALGTSQALTITVTGAGTNDTVCLGPPADLGTALADSLFSTFVSSVNTVTVTRTGLAATTAYTNRTWRVEVKQY